MMSDFPGKTTAVSIKGQTCIDRTAAYVMAVVTLLTFLVLPLSGQASDEFLAPEVAFKFSARMLNPETAEVSYTVADGYYMYREAFRFKAAGARIGEAAIPTGTVKYDETFQKDVEIHRNRLAIRIPVDASGPFRITVTAQGCADGGICYPPMESTAELIPASISTNTVPDSEMGTIEASLSGGRLLTIVPLFILLGLGLAFTPCVLPMVPILSSIIIGDRAMVSRGRGLVLSAIYVFGMATVYTLLGVAAGLAGEGLAAALQNAWVLGSFAFLMVVLSLAMFGFYQLQMPAAVQENILKISGKRGTGKLGGVFVMGALSALIVGPCVAAPLAGVLVYISHTRDVLVGGAALFAMAIGMGIPLLLVGASAGTLLPRAGVWMDSVKRFFGILMLATALWMISPVIPAALQMLGWAALGIGYAISLFFPKKSGWLAKTAALGFFGFGMIQLVGVASGGRDVFAPLAHLSGQREHPTEFTRVRSVNELEQILSAPPPDKIVMLDFYADWCVSCKEMEKLTFSDSRVQAEFSNMVLLQADVTANNDDDKALLKRFRLFGPPGIIFFDQSGKEIPGTRVIGYQNTATFLKSLEAVRQSDTTPSKTPTFLHQ